MEDQRNWTDASFKTYSTPLELPFPVEVAAGERIFQRVVLSIMTHETATTATAV
jgi:D-apionolactonase